MADYIGATPQNPLLGLLYGGYDYLRSPQRTQQMQGLASLLESTGIPKTIERMSYGEPLTNIGRANVPLLKPETAEAMMTVAPMAGPAARGAGRLVGSQINRAMMGEGGLLAPITPQPMRLDVYHGSPHKFEKFDPSKIGTGEGNQSYGAGAYLAEARPVAEQYSKDVSKVNPIFSVGSEQITPVTNPTTPLEKAKNYLYESAVINIVEGDRRKTAKTLLNEAWYGADYSFKGEELNAVRSEISKLIESKGKKILKVPEGNIYKVDLPDEKIASMLDWDMPISSQSQAVKDLASKYGVSESDLGGDLLAKVGKGLKGSSIMNQAGITGVKYFDEGSRDLLSGTKNFVVFPEQSDYLKILERNDQPIQGLLSP